METYTISVPLWPFVLVLAVAAIIILIPYLQFVTEMGVAFWLTIGTIVVPTIFILFEEPWVGIGTIVWIGGGVALAKAEFSDAVVALWGSFAPGVALLIAMLFFI